MRQNSSAAVAGSTLPKQLHGKSVVFFGPRDNPRCQRWWAEKGQLHCVDSRDNSFVTVSVRDFLLRLQAVNDMLSNGRRKENENFAHRDEVERHMRFVEEAVELVRKAKEQGIPEDPRVLQAKLQSAPTSVSVPAAIQ